MAIAMRVSVTVSIFAERIGMDKWIPGTSQVSVDTSALLWMVERRGTSRTSSNVSPISGRMFICTPNYDRLTVIMVFINFSPVNSGFLTQPMNMIIG
jgi:hypothetical protein